MATDAVRFDGVTFRYGQTAVVRDVSFAVPKGSFLTLLGPSGCGKTTLLKLIGGYLAPNAGRLFLGGQDTTGRPPERRNIGMVFQNYALFPHLSARKNVAFGLEVRGVPVTECNRCVDEVLDRVGLAKAERERYPAQLSGGQQQRVALARALAFTPDVLLLDEPLANLDRHLREQLRAELRRVHETTGVTTIMVTHDQDEALAVSDLVGVMHTERLLQLGTPQDVYHRPRTPFVARFLGAANLLDGTLLGARPDAVMMIRPERVTLDGHYPGTVTGVSFHGSDLCAVVQCGRFTLQIRCRATAKLAVGDCVNLGIAASDCWEIPEPDAVS